MHDRHTLVYHIDFRFKVMLSSCASYILILCIHFVFSDNTFISYMPACVTVRMLYVSHRCNAVRECGRKAAAVIRPETSRERSCCCEPEHSKRRSQHRRIILHVGMHAGIGVSIARLHNREDWGQSCPLGYAAHQRRGWDARDNDRWQWF
jgi:hypothetical protein